MVGTARHVAAMVRSHASGDDAGFYSVALQVAAREAKAGHHALAHDIKDGIADTLKWFEVRENILDGF